MALAIERVLRRPPKSAPRTAPAPATSSVAWRERVSASSSSTRRSRLGERALEPVALRLEPVADLRRLGVGALLRRGVAAGRELLGRLSGARDELQPAVPLELERATVDEVPLDVLRRRAVEARLAEWRLGRT